MIGLCYHMAYQNGVKIYTVLLGTEFQPPNASTIMYYIIWKWEMHFYQSKMVCRYSKIPPLNLGVSISEAELIDWIHDRQSTGKTHDKAIPCPDSIMMVQYIIGDGHCDSLFWR